MKRAKREQKHIKLRRLHNFNPDGSPLSGAETIRVVRQQTDTILMSFSCGKDSIAAWLAIRDTFPNIVPFYMWIVPGLEFVEKSLSYFEDYFNTEIVRIPHPSFWRWMNNYMWQPPERCMVIDAANVANYNYDQLNEVLLSWLGLPSHTFICAGVRAADSPMRRAAINQYGSINWKRRYFYPVWDMYKDELIDLVLENNVLLPVDYDWFGRSFDGVDYRFLAPLRKHSPRDFERIMEWFPMAQLEIMRYEEMQKDIREKNNAT